MFKACLVKTNRLFREGLVLLLRGYQYFISPLLGQRCRFAPSCSHYAIEALTHYNVLKACYLVFRRIIRCHPFSPGGYDPLVTLKDQSKKSTINDCPERGSLLK